VFVKREGAADYAEVVVPAGASVAALKKLVKEELELEAPLDAVTLTKEGEDTPLDSRMKVHKAFGDADSLSLIVKAPKVERAPGAWLAMRGSLPAKGRARARQRRCARAARSRCCNPRVPVARASSCRCAQSASGQSLVHPV
jgi:hypothetical protein